MAGGCSSPCLSSTSILLFLHFLQLHEVVSCSNPKFTTIATQQTNPISHIIPPPQRGHTLFSEHGGVRVTGSSVLSCSFLLGWDRVQPGLWSRSLFSGLLSHYLIICGTYGSTTLYFLSVLRLLKHIIMM